MLVGSRWKLFVCKHECPKAFKCQIVHGFDTLLLKLVVLIDALDYCHISTLDEVDDFTSFEVLYDHTHAFTIACELDHTNHLVLLFSAENVDRDHIRVTVFEESKTTIPTHLEEGNFVHAGTGVTHFVGCLLVFRLILDNVVAYAETSP